MDPVLPPGLFKAGQQGGVKPPGPVVTQRAGPLISQGADDISALLVPALAAAAAAGLGTDNPVGNAAMKALTGFKFPPTGGPGIPTPFAALFLLPQPLGALPERFFMQKPRIPGTNIFLDPLHNLTRQLNRREQGQQRAAAASQRIQFANLLEDLTEDELLTLLTRRDLREQYLAFLDPRFVVEELRAERNRRVAKRNIEEGQQRYLEAQSEDDVIRRAIIFVLTIDALFAANPPDP